MTPDTGPGLSGFLAHIVWAAYQHFPFPGTYDWLVLFALCAAVVYGVYLPFLWSSVRADLQNLKDRRTGQPLHQAVWSGCWALAWLFFLLWFFATPVGHTFLAGRHLPGGVGPGEVHPPLRWWMLGGTLLLLVGHIYVARWAYDRLAAGGLLSAGHIPERTFLCLYTGGGALAHRTNREVIPSTTVVVAVLLPVNACSLSWSAASEVLMACFLAAALLAEGARMGFVYVWHKRTFG